jgi:hypothetical protein
MNLNIKFRLVLILIIIGLFIPASYSQLPTYTMTMSNDSVVAPNVYEFDIYLLNTSTNIFQLFGFQFGILYDSTNFRGDTLTASWVSGSNDTALVASNQVNNTISTAMKGIIRLDPKIARFGRGAIISNSFPGTGIGRLRLTATKPFNPQNLNLTWSSAPPWKTLVAAFDYTTHLSADITVPANHHISFHKHDVPPPPAK